MGHRPDLLRDKLGEPGSLRQRYHRDQPGPRHQMRVIERMRVFLPGYATIALDRCPLETGLRKLQLLPLSQFGGHLSR